MHAVTLPYSRHSNCLIITLDAVNLEVSGYCAFSLVALAPNLALSTFTG